MTQRVARQALYEHVWKEPLTRIAKAYGITGTGLAKVCRKLAVPVPPRGHWTKLRHGKPSPRLPLPPLKPGARTEAEIHPPYGAPRDNPLPPDLQARLDAESLPESRILVPDRLHRPHPTVAAAAAVFHNAGPDKYGMVSLAGGLLAVRCSPAQGRRALRLMDALIKALEARGCPVSVTANRWQGTATRIGGEAVGFRLEERSERSAHELTADERRQKAEGWSYFHKYDYVPCGALSIILDEYSEAAVRKRWTDRENHKLEDMLNEVVRGMIVMAADHRAARLKHEEEAQIRAEEVRRAAERAARERIEAAREKALRRQAREFAEARELRDYIAAATRTAKALSPDVEAWLNWASERATVLDPLARPVADLAREHREMPDPGEPERRPWSAVPRGRI